MKRLLSLVLAIITLVSVAIISTGAVSDDSYRYYISFEEFEDVNVFNGEVLGYIGDLDSDRKISIMDTTIVQFAIAKKTILNDTQKLIADTDRDNNISVMDATSIQRYIAKFTSDLKVAHTLYVVNKSNDKKEDMFNQIVDHLRTTNAYDVGKEGYMQKVYYDKRRVSIIYNAREDSLTFWYLDALTGGKKLTEDIKLVVTRDSEDFTFAILRQSATYDVYLEVDGNAVLTNTTDFDFDIDFYFFAGIGNSYDGDEEKAQPYMEEFFMKPINESKKMLDEFVSGDFYALFMPHATEN